MPYTDLGAPQSRNEMYLMNMLGATYEPGEPQSRIEYLLKEILENGGGSGDVTGVKGALEEAFRKGNVILTLAEIVALAGGLSFNEDTNELHGPQYDVMPTPASTWHKKIIQYVGDDSGSNICGHFYKCINDAGTYKWVDLSANSLTQEQLSALLAILD